MARRTKAGLDKLVAEIEAEGGSASGFMLNAVEDGSIEQLVTHVEANVGPIAVAVFNLGAQIGDRGLASTTLKQFEMGWRMATFGLFRLARFCHGRAAHAVPVIERAVRSQGYPRRAHRHRRRSGRTRHPERRNEEILGQAKRLLTKTLEPLNEALDGRDHMLGELSGVDFMLGHACYTARRLGCMPEDMTRLRAYVTRLEARPAFDKGIKT